MRVIEVSDKVLCLRHPKRESEVGFRQRAEMLYDELHPEKPVDECRASFERWWLRREGKPAGEWNEVQERYVDDYTNSHYRSFRYGWENTP